MRLPLKDALVRWAGERGYRIAWGGPRVLDEIRREIEDRCDAGEIGPKVVENYLGRSGFLAGAALPRVGTVGVIAIPRPAHRLDFALDGGTLETVVPPTYVGYDDLARSVVEELAPLVSEAGHRGCQEICPQNAGRFTLERAPERFSAEETEAILAGAGGEAIGAGVRAKLVALGLAGYEAQIGRNLRALVARSPSSRRRPSSS